MLFVKVEILQVSCSKKSLYWPISSAPEICTNLLVKILLAWTPSNGIDQGVESDLLKKMFEVCGANHSIWYAFI